MTGAEHYAEAERLIELARYEANPPKLGSRVRRERPSPRVYGGTFPDQVTLILADAQVHAILALAAATGAGSAYG